MAAAAAAAEARGARPAWGPRAERGCRRATRRSPRRAAACMGARAGGGADAPPQAGVAHGGEGGEGSRERIGVPGAIALITGTSVGAGTLALPSAALPAGFEPSAAVLVGAWALLYAEALLLTEVNVALMERRGSTDTVTLTAMAGETLGPTGAALTTGLYLVLTYTVMVAYDVKLAELFGSDLAPAAFTAAVAWLLLSGGRAAVAKANGPATGALLVSFLALCAGGWHAGDPSNLSRADWAGAPEVMPIAFLAMVFHKLVPTVCSGLDGDKDRIRLAFGLGSLMPLGILLAWTSVCLSMVPGGSASAAGVDPLDLIQSTGGPFLRAALPAFTLGAVATSYLGNALHLTDFGKAAMARVPFVDASSKALASSVAAISVAGTVLPPLYATFQHPADFLVITEFAGAYGMTVLFGLLPPLMLLGLRQQQFDEVCELSGGQDCVAVSPRERGLMGSLAAASIGIAVLHAQHDEHAAEAVQMATGFISSVFG